MTDEREKLAKRFGRNLKRERMKRQLTQEAFAEELGIHRTYQGAMERGDRNVTVKTVEQVAEKLGISPMDLLADDADADDDE